VISLLLKVIPINSLSIYFVIALFNLKRGYYSFGVKLKMIPIVSQGKFEKESFLILEF